MIHDSRPDPRPLRCPLFLLCREQRNLEVDTDQPPRVGTNVKSEWTLGILLVGTVPRWGSLRLMNRTPPGPGPVPIKTCSGGSVRLHAAFIQLLVQIPLSVVLECVRLVINPNTKQSLLTLGLTPLSSQPHRR